MTRKARIRLDRDSGRWTVVLPTLGFGAAQTYEFDDQPSALRWVDRRIQRQGSVGAVTQVVIRRHDVAAVSRTEWRQGYW